MDRPALKWRVDSASLHGTTQIMTRAIGSSQAAQITRAAEDCIDPFWSSDGATVYYNSGNAVWAVPASGGAAERVLDNAYTNTIHADGKTVVFRRDGKLWIGSPRSREARAPNRWR